MAAKWRHRGEPSSTPPGPVTRNKRDNHPSPAVGSPAAELFRGLNGKRTDNRNSPAWHGGIESDIAENGISADQVNEFLATNQRAFAARFAAPPVPPTSSNSSDASILMPPPHLPTPGQVAAQSAPNNTFDQGSRLSEFERFYGQQNQVLDGSGRSVSQAHARLAAAQELQNIRQQQANQAGVARNNSNPTGTLTLTGHLGGLGTAGQLGANPSTTGSSSTSKRRSGAKKSSGSKGGGGRWTKEEDSKLRSAVQAVGASNWKMIATDYLGDLRTDVQCLHRWQKVLQPGLVKGPWTKEEDQIIIDCIEAGITKWSEIAERIPGRIGKQCRERWFNHLDPSLKKGGWTEEEDAILVEAQAKWGNSWTKIAKLLPGRSENAVKNRWNSATRRRQKDQQRTADKITSDAIAIVNAADVAEKLAEQERAANGNSSRGHADDEDTECVPRSAIALLRAKREEARRAMELGLPPPDNCIGLGLHPNGPIIHPVKQNPAMDLDSLPKGKHDECEDEDSNDDYDDEDDNGVESEDAAVADMLEDVTEELDIDSNDSIPAVPVTGLRESNMDHLFTDSTLTEREKELIYRAYLAGIAQSGATPPSSGSPTSKIEKGGNNKIKFKRERGSKNKNSLGVQWDFNSEGTSTGHTSGNSSLPDGFLHEYGIEFPDEVEHLSGDRRVDLDDDLELSSSLLTMSLDKDIPIDEMALSAGERLMLTRPMAEDAMASLNMYVSSSSGRRGANSASRRGGGFRKSKHEAGPSSSPSGPLADTSATQADFSIELNGTSSNSSMKTSRPSKSTGHRTRQSSSSNSNSLEGLLDNPLSYNPLDKGSSLIGEQQKAEVRREVLFAQNLENHQGGQNVSPNVYGLDLFDPSGSAELANSGDLVDLVNSPNLWMSNSLSFSSLSPTSSSPSNSNSQSSMGLPVV